MDSISLLGWLCLALAAVGSAYMLAAARAVRRLFAPARTPRPVSNAAVTILKPLYGAEPRLLDNLATFLAQDHAGSIQLLCGVARADDPAVAAVEALRRQRPDACIDLVIDATPHGSNGKVANLVNMAPFIAHPIVVLSDSDMAVGRDYLARVLEALEAPGTGVVTCLYRGRGDGGFWARLGAAGLSYQFLPNAAFATTTGQLGDACMGSTIALRRETLAAIGGFARFADILADDHAIGQAVRGLGLAIRVPPLLITHASVAPDFGALWRHELRWAATVRGVAPAFGYAASLVTMPLPLAAFGALAHPRAGTVLLGVAWATRAVVAKAVDAAAGARTASAWLLPARDFLSLAVFVASYGARSVDWRGMRLRMTSEGRIAPHTESPDR